MHVSLSSLLLFCFKRNFLIVHFAQSLPTMIRAIPKNKKPLFCKKLVWKYYLTTDLITRQGENSSVG